MHYHSHLNFLIHMLCQLNGWFCWLLSGVGSIYPYCQINCFKVSAKLVVPEWAWSSPMVSRNISWIGFKLSSCNWSQTEIWEYHWTYKGMKICGLELWTFYSSPFWKSFQNECICTRRVFFGVTNRGINEVYFRKLLWKGSTWILLQRIIQVIWHLL